MGSVEMLVAKGVVELREVYNDVACRGGGFEGDKD